MLMDEILGGLWIYLYLCLTYILIPIILTYKKQCVTKY